MKSRPLRIAIVTNRFHPEVGGAETNIFFQARELAKTHRVTVFCPKRIDRPSTEEIDGVRVRRMFNLYNPTGRFPYLRAATFCPALLLRILFGDFDVVQCFPALTYNNMLAFLACKLRRIPILLCSFDYLDYAGMIARQGSVPPDLLEKHVPKPWTRWFLSRFDHISAIAGKEVRFFKRFNSRVSYSPVPVDPEEYANIPDGPKNSLGIPSDAFVYLCLGRVSQIKGQDLAVEAFGRIAADMKDARLVIVGRQDYEPDFADRLRETARRHQIDGRVVLTGELAREEALAWLKRANIHIIPVRFMNAGAVVVESWISGTPVIQSDAVDPNLVQEGRNGYLFESESVSALVSAMKRSYENRKNLADMGQKGAELVRSGYTYSHLIELYESIYRPLARG